MNKSEFIISVAEQMNVTKADAAKAVEAVFGTVKSALSEGNELRIIGFGTFKVADVPAKVVRNPQNGEKVQVPACKRPRFVPGKGLKEAVNS